MNKNEVETMIRDIERKTLTAMNSGFHFKQDQGGEFTRIFEFYKSQIKSIESSGKAEGEAARLLESLMSHPDFLNDEPILFSHEFSGRIGSMARVVDKYLER
ncbi:hypothetical protein [Sporosarcina sp. FSL K6-2383]|uniref:hypothetical protein n=1 Tax=Sporosarcina sp. FSL K6-2383 TaxID=2921556 RepID=UPI00315B2015